MGHEIKYFTFKTTKDKKEIVDECNRYAERCSDYGGGLYEPIRFMTNVFNSEDEAYAYLDGLSLGDYNQYAVQYRKLDNKPSKQLQEKKQRLNELSKKHYDLMTTQHYTTSTVKSEFLGCKNCGSRLAVKYLRGNQCPLCRTDLRPKTTLDRLHTMEENIAELKKRIDDLSRVENAKAAERAKKCETFWLVRIEYHV